MTGISHDEALALLRPPLVPEVKARFTLPREACTATSTPGKLYFDGVFECFTLEDVVRRDPDPSTPQNEAKVHGETAIPAGIYEICLEDSPRFGKDTITIKDVPGFSGIRMHGGTNHRHSEGCPLLGKIRHSPDLIGNCAPAVEGVKEKLCAARERGERMFIHIIDPPAV